MPKPKIVLFSPAISACSCWKDLFNTEFETEPVHSEGKFIKKLRKESIDAAIICLCSAHESEANQLGRLETLSGPVPVLTCSKSLNPGFIKKAALKGVSRFLVCTMEKETIQEIIAEAILHGGIKEFLETCYPGSFSLSPHIPKMIEEIIDAFPHRMSEAEISGRLGISQSWLQKLCRQAFDQSFSQLMRRIRVHQALRLMRHTNLDNTEIALFLDYSEESNIARDFRKELGYSPTRARQHLVEQTPEELLGK